MTQTQTERNGKHDRAAVAVPAPLRLPWPPEISPDDPAAVAVRAALVHGVTRLQANEPAAARGEVEGIHRMRAAARRLRGALQIYQNLLDPHWSAGLAEALKGLGRQLGAVRDVDVMVARFRGVAGDMAQALEPLFQTLQERHDDASLSLRSALEGEGHRSLWERLIEAAVHPVLEVEAREPCRRALPRLVRDAWTQLKTRGRGLRTDDPEEDFHTVRKLAKRARHATESVAVALKPSVRKDAARFARRARAVQDVLGAHQDAIVSGRTIAEIGALHPANGPFNLAAGRLLERQEQIARQSREQFFSVWDQLDRARLRRWWRR